MGHKATCEMPAHESISWRAQLNESAAGQALHEIDPTVLLTAIRDGAKPKTEVHLSPATEQLRDTLMDTFKQKHKQETKAAKATEKMIASIREHAHCKIEDHLADGLDQERDALMDTFKQKHKQEAKAAKATEKMIASIREHAHCKMEDHLAD